MLSFFLTLFSTKIVRSGYQFFSPLLFLAHYLRGFKELKCGTAWQNPAVVNVVPLWFLATRNGMREINERGTKSNPFSVWLLFVHKPFIFSSSLCTWTARVKRWYTITHTNIDNLGNNILDDWKNLSFVVKRLQPCLLAVGFLKNAGKSSWRWRMIHACMSQRMFDAVPCKSRNELKEQWIFWSKFSPSLPLSLSPCFKLTLPQLAGKQLLSHCFSLRSAPVLSWPAYDWWYFMGQETQVMGLPITPPLPYAICSTHFQPSHL